MNNKGVTLIELLIVIIVMGILATVAISNIGSIIENQRQKVDQANAEYLSEVISLAYLDGNISIKNNRLYNNDTERGYTGTGSWFFEDMSGYVQNRIVPEATIAQNRHNVNGSTYRFLFSVSGQEVTVFYYNENRGRIDLHTFELEGY